MFKYGDNLVVIKESSYVLRKGDKVMCLGERPFDGWVVVTSENFKDRGVGFKLDINNEIFHQPPNNQFVWGAPNVHFELMMNNICGECINSCISQDPNYKECPFFKRVKI